MSHVYWEGGRTLSIAPGIELRNKVLDHSRAVQFPPGSSWQNLAEGTTATSLPSMLALKLSHSACEGNPGSPGRFRHCELPFAGWATSKMREQRRGTLSIHTISIYFTLCKGFKRLKGLIIIIEHPSELYIACFRECVGKCQSYPS